MTGHRQVQQFFCQKCDGTGWVMGKDMFGYPTVAQCLHAKRTDVTGLDDDTEKILALEAEVARLAELHQIALRVVAENDEAKSYLEAVGVDRWVGRSILEMVIDACKRLLPSQLAKARDSALEEAAKECERLAAQSDGVDDRLTKHGSEELRFAADMVRALKTGGK